MPGLQGWPERSGRRLGLLCDPCRCSHMAWPWGGFSGGRAICCLRSLTTACLLLASASFPLGTRASNSTRTVSPQCVSIWPDSAVWSSDAAAAAVGVDSPSPWWQGNSDGLAVSLDNSTCYTLGLGQVVVPGNLVVAGQPGFTSPTLDLAFEFAQAVMRQGCWWWWRVWEVS